MKSTIILSTIVIAITFFATLLNAQKPFYCQADLPSPSEDTDGYTLQMVQILTRHGDRTPLYNPLTVKMDTWNCTLATYMWPSSGDAESTELPSRLFRKVYLPGRNFFPGNCSTGQLTSLGYDQHINVGTVFRSLYVEKYQLLSPSLSTEEVWVRSTDIPRTVQSAQAEINALYPPETNNGVPTAQVIDIHTMDDYFDNMYAPNTQLCPYLNTLLYNSTTTPEYQQFVQQYQPLMNQIMQALEIHGSQPEWSSLMDLFYALECHGMTLPEGITPDMVNQVYQAAFWEDSYQLSFPMIARLGMSTFLEEMVDNIRNYMNGNSTYKYMLFSGHDDSVGPFVNLFGLYKEWAPYASHVELELWTDSNNDYFLQFKFNGQSYELNGCNGYMCPIETFFDIAYQILVPDYLDICNQNN